MANLYSGVATVSAIDFIAPRFDRDLSEDDKANGFEIDFTVSWGDGEKAHVFCEFTNRECGGALAGKLQKDVSIETLKKIELIDGDDISTVMKAIGKKVNIYQRESAKENQNGEKFVNTYFSSSSFRRLDNADIRSRMAAMFGNRSNNGSNPLGI